jgi:hypothetical protein
MSFAPLIDERQGRRPPSLFTILRTPEKENKED